MLSYIITSHCSHFDIFRTAIGQIWSRIFINNIWESFAQWKSSFLTAQDARRGVGQSRRAQAGRSDDAPEFCAENESPKERAKHGNMTWS